MSVSSAERHLSGHFPRGFPPRAVATRTPTGSCADTSRAASMCRTIAKPNSAQSLGNSTNDPERPRNIKPQPRILKAVLRRSVESTDRKSAKSITTSRNAKSIIAAHEAVNRRKIVRQHLATAHHELCDQFVRKRAERCLVGRACEESIAFSWHIAAHDHEHHALAGYGLNLLRPNFDHRENSLHRRDDRGQRAKPVLVVNHVHQETAAL